MATRLPELGYGDQFLIFNFLLHGKNQIEMETRVVRFVLQKSKQALRHAQLQIITQRQSGAHGTGKTGQQFLQQRGFAIANIHPLRHIANKRRSMTLFRTKRGEKPGMGIQQGDAFAHLTGSHVVFQFSQEGVREFDGAHGLVIST